MENGFSTTKQNIYSFQDAIVNKLIAENKFVDLKKINELIVLRTKLSSDYIKDLEEILAARGKSPSYIELENRFKNQNTPKVEEKPLEANVKVESTETSIKPIEESQSTPSTKVETQTKISVEERELKLLI
jgi:hypothetical protein